MCTQRGVRVSWVKGSRVGGGGPHGSKVCARSITTYRSEPKPRLREGPPCLRPLGFIEVNSTERAEAASDRQVEVNQGRLLGQWWVAPDAVGQAGVPSTGMQEAQRDLAVFELTDGIQQFASCSCPGGSVRSDERGLTNCSSEEFEVAKEAAVAGWCSEEAVWEVGGQLGSVNPLRSNHFALR